MRIVPFCLVLKRIPEMFRSPQSIVGEKRDVFLGLLRKPVFGDHLPAPRNRPRKSPGVRCLGRNSDAATGHPGAIFFQKLPEKTGFRGFFLGRNRPLCSTMFREVADVRHGGGSRSRRDFEEFGGKKSCPPSQGWSPDDRALKKPLVAARDFLGHCLEITTTANTTNTLEYA